MNAAGIAQIGAYFLVIVLLAKPLGSYMAAVFEGRRTILNPALRWMERLTYKAAGVREEAEQRWTQYTASLLSCGGAAVLAGRGTEPEALHDRHHGRGRQADDRAGPGSFAGGD